MKLAERPTEYRGVKPAWRLAVTWSLQITETLSLASNIWSHTTIGTHRRPEWWQMHVPRINIPQNPVHHIHTRYTHHRKWGTGCPNFPPDTSPMSKWTLVPSPHPGQWSLPRPNCTVVDASDIPVTAWNSNWYWNDWYQYNSYWN